MRSVTLQTAVLSGTLGLIYGFVIRDEILVLMMGFSTLVAVGLLRGRTS